MGGTIRGYLEKLGGNFMVAAFIPALAFVTACMISFKPLLPTEFVDNVQIALSPLDENGFIILLIATMMGFTLTSLNTYIYKLFEGYVLTRYLKPLQRLEVRRARQIRNQRDALHKKIKRMEKWQMGWSLAGMPDLPKEKLDRIDDRITRLTNQRDALAADYELRYPPADALIMPTRLGNILKAAEAYPQSRYGVDSVALFPRLAIAIDKEYMGHMDTANDQCSFLLNSCLLSGFFMMLAFSASLYLWLFPNPDHSSLTYLLTGIVTSAIAWFFYNASLMNVSKYGNLIRSSYDLFRFGLLEKLHLPLPADSVEEKELWMDVTEFVTVGELYRKIPFGYPSHAGKEEM